MSAPLMTACQARARLRGALHKERARLSSALHMDKARFRSALNIAKPKPRVMIMRGHRMTRRLIEFLRNAW